MNCRLNMKILCVGIICILILVVAYDIYNVYVK